MNRIIFGSMGAGITWTVITYQLFLTRNWLWLLLLLTNLIWAGLILWGMGDTENELIDTQIELQHLQENADDTH